MGMVLLHLNLTAFWLNQQFASDWTWSGGGTRGCTEGAGGSPRPGIGRFKLGPVLCSPRLAHRHSLKQKRIGTFDDFRVRAHKYKRRKSYIQNAFYVSLYLIERTDTLTRVPLFQAYLCKLKSLSLSLKLYIVHALYVCMYVLRP